MSLPSISRSFLSCSRKGGRSRLRTRLTRFSRQMSRNTNCSSEPQFALGVAARPCLRGASSAAAFRANNQLALCKCAQEGRWASEPSGRHYLPTAWQWNERTVAHTRTYTLTHTEQTQSHNKSTNWSRNFNQRYVLSEDLHQHMESTC